MNKLYKDLKIGPNTTQPMSIPTSLIREFELAKNMLREGCAMDLIKKVTGLDQVAIEKIS